VVVIHLTSTLSVLHINDQQLIHLELASLHLHSNCIRDVMVSVLTSSAIDRGFEPRSGHTKDYKISICCFSVKQRVKTGWQRIRIMCHIILTNRSLSNLYLHIYINSYPNKLLSINKINKSFFFFFFQFKVFIEFNQQPIYLWRKF
jgi:hypothetical protein